jgi:hypothetical protein
MTGHKSAWGRAVLVCAAVFGFHRGVWAAPTAEPLRGILKQVDEAHRTVTIVVKGKGDVKIRLADKGSIRTSRPIKPKELKEGDFVAVFGKFSSDKSTIENASVRRLPDRGRVRIADNAIFGVLRLNSGGMAVEADGRTIKVEGTPRELSEIVLVGFDDILPGQIASTPAPADASSILVTDALIVAPNPKKKDVAFVIYEGKLGLPNVLVLGDSISMGYTLPVRAQLEGRANVYRPGENCFDTSVGLEKLDDWLGQKKWAVIHFNWGLHDIKHVVDGKLDPAGPINIPITDYEANLRRLVERLKKTGAKLIWASTTPVPEGAEGRAAEDVRRYNQAAKRVMDDLGVPVDDLYAFVLPRHDKIMKKPGNVHYSDEGYKLLAGQVVKAIEPSLP